jgi:nicotinamidase/pyrazinamidase
MDGPRPALLGERAKRSLREQNVDTLHVAGLPLDCCVRATALEARRAGSGVVPHRDAVRAINAEAGDEERTLGELREAGAEVLN